MPFTVSHIAAVVPAYRPLSRLRLFSAAVIGSMVPDFGLLLPGSFERWQTHSLPGLLTFCLPVGVAAYALTQWLIKPALLEVLPDGAYARLQAQEAAAVGRAAARSRVPVALQSIGSEHGARAANEAFDVRGSLEQGRTRVRAAAGGAMARTLTTASITTITSVSERADVGDEPLWPRLPGRRWRWLGVPLALLFGSITHLIWDGFTHENARGVQLFPQLLDYGPQMAGHSLRLYIWLQYGSSVVGLLVLAGALALWLHHAPAPRSRPPRRLQPAERGGWVFAYLALPAAGLAWSLLHSLVLQREIPLGWELGRAALISLRSAALSLLLISALIRVRLSI